MILLVALRSLMFQLGYVGSTVIWGCVCLIAVPLLPYHLRFRIAVLYWTGFILWWLRLTCGVTHRIHGLENIPAEPCVVLCKHQSTWETYLLQSLFVPTASVLKRELLMIPFFGWVYRLLKPIPIDRSKPTAAGKQLIREGKSRLNEGIWITLLPEGTRVPTGTTGRFQRGGAALARAADVPILCVAHDAGKCWPAHRFMKFPGEIQVVISPVLSLDARTDEEVTRLAEGWTRAAMESLETRDGPSLYARTPMESIGVRSDVEVRHG